MFANHDDRRTITHCRCGILNRQKDGILIQVHNAFLIGSQRKAIHPGIHGEIREHRLAFISRVSPTRWCNKHVCTGPSKMPNEPLPSSLSFSLFLLLWHLKKICPDDARRWLRASCGIASRETAAPPPLSRDDCMSRYCNISIYRSIISWRVRRSASDPQMKLCSRSFHFWPQIHETASTMMMIDRSCAAR